MNKRQAKKAFKKKYGYNYHEVIDAENIQNLVLGIKKELPTITKTIEKGLKKMNVQIKNLYNEIYL